MFSGLIPQEIRGDPQRKEYEISPAAGKFINQVKTNFYNKKVFYGHCSGVFSMRCLSLAFFLVF